MLPFWVAASLLLVFSLALLVPPLLGKRRIVVLDREAQNIAIAKERLKELEAQKAKGDLSNDEYERARSELELSLAADIESTTTASDSVQATQETKPIAAIVVAAALPVVALGLYFGLGEPRILFFPGGTVNATTSPGSPSEDPSNMSPAQLIQHVEERLKETPDDVRGWSILANAYMRGQRFSEAVRAFENLRRLIGDDPNMLVQYADAVAMANNGNLQGKARELLETALEGDPDQPQGLWLAGMSAENRGELAQALNYWYRLLPLLAGDPQSEGEIKLMIARAEQNAEAEGIALPERPQPSATQSLTDTAGAVLSVNVSLSPDVANNATPTDTVFVLARAAGGPPLPLAVARKTAADLPFTVVLEDEMAMVPDMKLSNFEQVDIIARVSRSGNAKAQSGDIEGTVSKVSVGTSDPIDIVISKVLP